MMVDWVLMTFVDRSELLLKRSGEFEDSQITGLEIKEKNNIIKVSVANKTIVSYPMANIISYTYSQEHEIK